MRQEQGFTVLELLIAVSVGTALAVLGAGMLRSASRAAHSAAAQAELAEALATSFNHSTIIQKKVVLCPSLGEAMCRSGYDWSEGWIAFVDVDENRERDPGETLIRAHSKLGNGILLLTSAGRTRIVFQPFGGVNAGTNATFTFCDGRGPTKASTIVLANSGRMRTAQATPEQAAACTNPI